MNPLSPDRPRREYTWRSSDRGIRRPLGPGTLTAMITHSSTAFADIDTSMPIPDRRVVREEVVLVMNAGTESGYRTARDLLRRGYRVAVTDRSATRLARILTGISATQVLAIAADPTDNGQLERIVEKAEHVFGRRIDMVIDAEGGLL
ncbi:SDR family NAD(P)-dependent oxidoreductase [Mycolicibacterium pulveris]|uniref:SDR family NAD(P)-dependent oxidoreductase n=1 Tax=Mycolicibacterium pulveris TaxID=36813 RepID=UPI003CEE6A85